MERMLFVNTGVKQKGIALIAVLWVVAFLSAIASTVAHQSRTILQMTKNRIEQLKLKQAAESAVLISIADKINSPQLQSLLTMNNTFDGMQIKLLVSDESGKVDINTAPSEILQSLLVEIGLNEEESQSITNVILDWRDEDSLVRLGGAEDQNYKASDYQYGSKDAYFERVEELQLVYGMTQEIYEALLPYITVHTFDFGVNMSHASALVRRAVDNSSTFASSDEGTENLDVEDIDDEDFDDEDLEGFTSLTQGYIYTFQAIAQNQAGMKQSLSAIVRIDRGNTYEPFTVLSWH